jgi:hypothetical protein
LVPEGGVLMFPCPECRTKSPTNKAKDILYLKGQQRRYKCPACGFQFATIELLELKRLRGFPKGQKMPVGIKRPRKKPKIENPCWECNECGSQEYTKSVSEIDVQKLGCGKCGGIEWHRAESKD